MATRESTVSHLWRHCLGGQAKTKDKESQSGDLRGQGKLLLFSSWLSPILLGFRYQQLMGQQWLASTFLSSRLSPGVCTLWHLIVRCYVLNVCVAPNSCSEILTCWMVFGDGGPMKWSVHLGGDLTNHISVLMKEAPRSSLGPPTVWEVALCQPGLHQELSLGGA